MKVLLTGSSGFLGQWLIWAFEKKGWHVFAPSFDIRNFKEVAESISNIPKPDVIVHLAGISSPDVAEKEPDLAFSVNTMGTQILITALEQSKKTAPLIYASTGQIYNIPKDIDYANIELDEKSEVRPQNIYALSKWQGELIVSDFVNRQALPQVVRLRMFNHTHFSQNPQFFLPRIYKILTEDVSSVVKIPVGNIEIYRDIGSIFDLCNAFVCLLESMSSLSSEEVFNLSSGTRRHLMSVALLLAKKMNKQVEFMVDPKRVRASEPTSICGKNDLIRSKIDWKPMTLTDEDLVESFLKKM